MYFKLQSSRRGVAALSAILFVLLLLSISTVSAQTTVFTYQGRFTDTSVQQPTSGTYTMTFRIFDAATGGSQVPNNTTSVTSMVSVVNGIFTVELDFGAIFNTAQQRYLEIQVGSTVLTPRQEITSTPFSQRALNAVNADRLGGAAANQFVQTTDSRLSDDRTPTAGSNNYIQNRVTRRVNANFNIGGNGTIAGNFTAGGTLNIYGTGTIGGNLTVEGTLNAELGQDAATVYGTGSLTVSRTNPTFALVPGLTQTINVPANSVLVILTDGGIQTLSTTDDGVSIVEVAIYVDGEIISARQHYMENIGRVISARTNWNLSGARTLTAGSHTIQVRTRSSSENGLSNAIVSRGGGADDLLRGQLTVTVIKK